MKQNINFWLKKHEDVGTRNFNDSKAFIIYSKNMVDIYKNIKIIMQIKNVNYCFWWYDCSYA